MNALVNENTSPPEGFGQRRLPRPRLTTRKAAGFTLNVIDCPGLSEGDAGCDVVRHLASWSWVILCEWSSAVVVS